MTNKSKGETVARILDATREAAERSAFAIIGKEVTNLFEAGEEIDCVTVVDAIEALQATTGSETERRSCERAISLLRGAETRRQST